MVEAIKPGAKPTFFFFFTSEPLADLGIVCLCVCEGVQRPRVNLRCHSSGAAVLFVEAEYLTKSPGSFIG